MLQRFAKSARPFGARALISMDGPRMPDASVMKARTSIIGWDQLFSSAGQPGFPASSPVGGQPNYAGIDKMVQHIETWVVDHVQEPQAQKVHSGLNEFNVVYRQLVESCDIGDSKSCVGLEVVDAMSEALMGAASSQGGELMLIQLQDSISAYRKKFSSWREAFDESDLNKDGLIDQGEFSAMCGKLHLGLDEMACKRIFDAADLNKDGNIQPHEFKSVMWDGGLLLTNFL